MRILPLLLLLTACSQEATERPSERLLYSGEGRDRLCIVGDRAGLIAYGQSDANCSVRGRLDRTGESSLTIIPDGDQDCSIPVEQQGGTVRLGKVTPACAYYCGPGSDFAGKRFTENPSASPAVDFAGDPLC